MMKTISERAPPAPPSGALELSISYMMGTMPAATATTTKLNARFERSAISMLQKLMVTMATPNSQLTTLSDQRIHGPTPASSRTIGA